MMNKRFLLLIPVMICFIFLTDRGYCQRRPMRSNIRMSLSGMVVDSSDQKPLHYASIILYSKKNNEQITGTVTDQHGMFELSDLRPGRFYAKVMFMGYDPKIIDPVALHPGNPTVDLGTILLRSSILIGEGVEVVGEKPAVEYKIDRKVINVSQQHTAVSGTAVDILENVPSVTVDIEGNVSLRGSSSFMVLIDNRPTILEPNDVLQQIPAGTIENIEIITNPSAKFEPDGTSGIINIITKKNQLQGINGIINVNVGQDEKYGSDFLLNYRTSVFNIYFGADYNRRRHSGTSDVEHRTFKQDTILNIFSKGDNTHGRNSYSMRGGMDISITKNDLLNLGLRVGNRSSEHGGKKNYNEWTEPGITHLYYISQDDSERGGDYYSLNLDYQHQFKKKGHEIQTRFMFSDRESIEDAQNTLLNLDQTINEAQKYIEEGPGERIDFKLDYTLPLRAKDQFQAGYQGRLRSSKDITSRSDYNVSLQRYELQSQYSRRVNYERNIHAVYGMYAGEFKKLGLQAGLRTEYTDRNVELMETKESYIVERWDFFPTGHLSYQLTKGQQMMMSYTRRIERPHGHHLEPFETWRDAYNVRKGNPDIKPEYIDSYEMGFQTYFGRNLISSEIYYRVTNNKMERVRSLYADNVTLQSIENVGKDYTFGFEFMTNIDFWKWWNLNLLGTVYQYKIEGTLYELPFSRESNNWTMRLNNTLKLTSSTRFQLMGMYNSPRITSQGRREGMFMINLGLRQEFFGRALSATFQVRDIFQTGKYEFTNEGKQFSTYSLFTRESPVVMLTLTYNINNYKQKRDGDEREENGEGMGEGGEF